MKHNNDPEAILRSALENRRAGFEAWKTELYQHQEQCRAPMSPDKLLAMPAKADNAPTPGSLYTGPHRVHVNVLVSGGGAGGSGVVQSTNGSANVSGGCGGSDGGGSATSCFCDVHGSGHAPSCQVAKSTQERVADDVWVSADGRATPIAALSNRHLVNIMRLMARGDRGLNRESRQWPAIVAEVKRRHLPHGVEGIDEPSEEISGTKSGRLSGGNGNLSQAPRVIEVAEGYTLPETWDAPRLRSLPLGEYKVTIVARRETTVRYTKREKIASYPALEFLLQDDDGCFYRWTTTSKQALTSAGGARSIVNLRVGSRATAVLAEAPHRYPHKFVCWKWGAPSSTVEP